MENLLKSYYLFSAKNASSFLVFLVTFFSGVALYGLLCAINLIAISTSSSFHLFLIFLVALSLCHVNGALVSAGIKKYISLPSSFWQLQASGYLDRGESAYEIFVSEDGSASYIDEPIIGKGTIYLVVLKPDRTEELEDSSVASFSLSFIYPIRIQLDNYALIVRFGIKADLIDDPDPQELYEKMLKSGKKHINDFLLESFKLVNNFSEGQLALMKLLADDLVGGKIDRSVFFERIKQQIVFPKELLSVIVQYSFAEFKENIFIDT